MASIVQDMVVDSVEPTVTVALSAAASDATSKTLPLMLARMTSEFLDFANLLADTDPADSLAIAELEALLARLPCRRTSRPV